VKNVWCGAEICGTYGSYLSAYDQTFLFVGFVVEGGGVCWERDDGSGCLFP
jgi:hypothetical protein